MPSITKSQAKAELWQRGILTWKLHRGQKLIDDAFNSIEGKLFVALCSRRYGKTYWGVTKALETAIKTSKAKIKICAQFQTDIEEIILPIINDIMSDIPSSIRPTFNVSKKKYIFKNKSEIALIGLDKKPNGLRGQYSTLILVDEAFLIENLNNLYSAVIIPTTMYQNNAKVIMISTPGLSVDCDFFQMCDKAKQEQAFVKFTIHDNPMVTPIMIEEYRKECLSISDFSREYECDWVTDNNLQIIQEWQDSYILSEPIRDDYFKYYRRYISFDIGTVDKTAFLYAYYDWKTQRVIIEEESELQGKDVTTLNINKALDSQPDYLKPFKTIADNNNLILIADLNSTFNKSVTPTNKDELHAMVNAVRLLVRDGRILVSDKCPNLISQLRSGLWDNNKKAFKRTKHHHQDHLAALIYLVRNLSEYDNPIPQSHYGSHFTHYMPEDENQTATIKNIKKLFNF